MRAFSAGRTSGFISASLAIAGLVVLQVMIGGRVMLFAFPGYCLIGAAGLVGLAASTRSKTRIDAACLYGTAIFCGYILIRCLASPSYYARQDIFAVLAALIFYALTVTVFTSTGARTGIIAVLLAFAMVHVVIGVIQFSRDDNFMPISFLQRVDYGARASGFYICPNHLAGLLEVVGIFGVSLLFWGRWPVWGKVMAAYASVVCYVGVALTGSRGGYVSVLASLLVFAGLSLVMIKAARPRSWQKLGALILVGVIACGLATTALIHQSGYLSQRAGAIVDTNNMRLKLWSAAIAQWKLQPIIGTGSETYRFYGKEFRVKDMQDDPTDVHNDYLHLLCEYGVLGAVAFLIFLAAHLRQGYRNLKYFAQRIPGASRLASDRVALNLGALSAVAAYIVHSVVDFNLHIPANAVLLAFVFGLITNIGISQEHKSAGSRLVTIPRLTATMLSLLLIFQSVRFYRGEYYSERSRTLLRDEDPTGSIDYAHKSLEYDRENPEVFFYLGRAFVAIAHQTENADERPPLFGRAIAAYEEARRLAPLDGAYPLNLAFTYDQAGNFRDAEKMFALARALDPNSAVVDAMYRNHRRLIEQKKGTSF